jgi:hypothetical protein
MVSTDVQATVANWRDARAKQKPFLSLVANITGPTKHRSLSRPQRPEGISSAVSSKICPTAEVSGSSKPVKS